jgi:ATP/maltotriose-dependent transcriptional regulator MalT
MRVWRWRALVAEAYLGVGSVDDAASVIEVLAHLVESGGLRSAQADVALLRGQLAEASADPDAALRWYRQIADAESSSAPLSVARLKLAHGALLRRRGANRAAIEQLRGARDILNRLGALPFLARCDDELKACGLRSSDGGGHDLLALTPREEAVAHLVAGGLSNREAAERLYVSTKAVEYHLGHIFAKLGITSRNQLSREFRHEVTAGS